MATKAKASPCDKCPRLPMRDASRVLPLEAPSGEPKLLVVVPDRLPDRAVTKMLDGVGVRTDDVAVAPLVQCHGDASTRRAAEKCCVKHLREFASQRRTPMLAVGPAAFKAFVDDKKGRFNGFRGTWYTDSEREIFPVMDPQEIRGMRDQRAKAAFGRQFGEDVMRMAERLLGKTPPTGVKIEIFDSPIAARDYLAWLAKHPGPWTFDIETYDAVEFPGRKEVATDPYHPDFRLRGVAIATADDAGAWIDLKGWDGRPEARECLDPAFLSGAAKQAFNGHFDHSGLAYTKTVTNVANRTGDAMLGAVATSDGSHESLRLEKLFVRHLGLPQYWFVDKSLMRDLPIEVVANGAVHDACSTHRLCHYFHVMLELGKHWGDSVPDEPRDTRFPYDGPHHGGSPRNKV